MKKRIILIIISGIFIIACGGGGSSGSSGGGSSGSGSSGSTSSTPTLSNVVFDTTTGAHSTSQMFHVSFNFTDPAGALDSGSMYCTYGGTNYGFGLSSTGSSSSGCGKTSCLAGSGASSSPLAAKTSGTGYSTITLPLNATVGPVNLPVWIVDKLGNASSKTNITLTQT